MGIVMPLDLRGNGFRHAHASGQIVPSTTNRQLPMSHFPWAFDRAPLPGPGSIQDLQGPFVHLGDLDGSKGRANLSCLGPPTGPPRHLRAVLTRDEFESMTADLLERCAEVVNEVLLTAEHPAPEVDDVVLVGGATRMPAVAALVRSLTGAEPVADVNPHEIVVAGAALQAGMMTGEFKDALPLDILSHSLGIETTGGVMTKFIRRNTTLPAKYSDVLTTAEDDQTSVTIQVFEGEHVLTSTARRSPFSYWRASSRLHAERRRSRCHSTSTLMVSCASPQWIWTRRRRCRSRCVTRQ